MLSGGSSSRCLDTGSVELARGSSLRTQNHASWVTHRCRGQDSLPLPARGADRPSSLLMRCGRWTLPARPRTVPGGRDANPGRWAPASHPQPPVVSEPSGPWDLLPKGTVLDRVRRPCPLAVPVGRVRDGPAHCPEGVSPPRAGAAAQRTHLKRGTGPPPRALPPPGKAGAAVPRPHPLLRVPQTDPGSGPARGASTSQSRTRRPAKPLSPATVPAGTRDRTAQGPARLTDLQKRVHTDVCAHGCVCARMCVGGPPT